MKFKYVCKCISFYGVSQKKKKKKDKINFKNTKKHFIKKRKEKKMYSILNYVYTVNLNNHF